MFCSKCGYKLDSNDKFCRGCGAPVNSGQSNSGSAGTSAQSQTQGMGTGVPGGMHPAGNAPQEYVRTADTGTAGTVSKASKGKILIASIAAVAVVAVGIILYSVLVVPQPKDVVNKFVNAINGKNINDAISCMDPKYELMYKGLSGALSGLTGGVQVSDLADLVPGMFDMFNQYGGGAMNYSLKIINVESEDISGDSATIRVNLEAKVTDTSGQSQVNDGEAVFTLQKFSQGWRIVNFQ